MSGPGLLYAAARIKDPQLTESVLNDWANNIHIPDVLGLPNSATVALRYKNTDPDAQWTYLTLYPLRDLSFVETMGSPEVHAKIRMGHPMLPAGVSMSDTMDPDIRNYSLIQKFEGQNPKEGRGSCIVAVAIEPAEGEEAEKEFDQWYRLQHLDMLSMVAGYRRSTRYKLEHSPMAKVTGQEPLPRYLALHEYDTTDLPVEQLKLVVGTEWSKKIIGSAKVFARDVWVLIHEGGDKQEKL